MSNAVRRMRSGGVARGLGCAVALGAMTACDHAASVLSQNGVSGTSETYLGWFLIVTACVVVLVVTILVPVAALRRRPPNTRGSTAIEPPHSAAESRWMTTFAIVIPALILTASFLFTIRTIDAVGAPRDASPKATVVVTGHQWWWELGYSDSTGQGFTTANEIHMPVGQPIEFKLTTADVIHSFWVPQLAGKMDIIPGQNNTTWLEARAPGVFSGPCGEYCGEQHAQMRLTVVAESPAAYATWLATQREPAPTPVSEELAAGQRVFMNSGCASCHTIRGTQAEATIGPDLTHLASRRTIAAGALPNTRANLMAWIVDPQAIKPGCDMPRMNVSGTQMPALIAYLETLK